MNVWKWVGTGTGKKSARINRWAYHCREQASERYNFHSTYADCRECDGYAEGQDREGNDLNRRKQR